MYYDRIVISSGHGKHVRGAAGNPGLDEVNEARRVVDHLADKLDARGCAVTVFHDDTSKSQNENLNTIVAFHNSQVRDLDVSVHFNAYQQTTKPMGTEVLYLTQGPLASKVSSAIASVGFINRGPKVRSDLAFLNKTEMPSILIEVCFVDSAADVEIYNKNFDAICENIATALVGEGDDVEEIDEIDEIPLPPPDEATVLTGKVSWFGGPEDSGVSPDEGLAFIYKISDAPYLFLPYQPEGTTGLARRLNPWIHYIACRWNYDEVSKTELLKHVALVSAVKTGISLKAFPADWGPHVDTDRIADISPGLMEDLGITTDDEVTVIFPFKGD